MVLVDLFLTFFRIGLFAIGGAYSFLPLIEKEVVERYHWLTREEFLDVLGIVKMFPGAISIKYATYTGNKIAGLPGVIVANLGNLLAPVALVAFAFGLYARYKGLPCVRKAFNYIELSVFAMIIAVAFKAVNISGLLQLRALVIIVISFTLFIYTKINPAIIIIASGLAGALLK